MDPSDSSPGPQALARALCPGCGCHPLRARSPVFSFCPSRRAVPATPGEQTGVPTDSCRPVLPSPPLQWLGLTVSRYEATSGFTHVTARRFAAAGCILRRSGPASAGCLAAPRRGPGFPIVGSCRDGLLSFHRVSRRFARRTERARERGRRCHVGWRNSWVGGDPKRDSSVWEVRRSPLSLAPPRKRGEGTRKGDQGAYTSPRA